MPASTSFSSESVQRCRQRCPFAVGSADLAALSQRFNYQKCYLCKLQPQNGGHPPLVSCMFLFLPSPLQTLLKAADGVCERCENADTPRDGQMDDDERGREGEKCRQREVTVFSSTIPVCLLSMAACACFPMCVCVGVIFVTSVLWHKNIT